MACYALSLFIINLIFLFALSSLDLYAVIVETHFCSLVEYFILYGKYKNKD